MSTRTESGEPEAGVKFDQEKERWDLVEWDPIRRMVRVVGLGARKYAANNWRRVANGKIRYGAALVRHVVAWCAGERNDPESGEHHLAHAMANCMFIIEIEKGEDGKQGNEEKT